jgi:hypothetical protein
MLTTVVPANAAAIRPLRVRAGYLRSAVVIAWVR